MLIDVGDTRLHVTERGAGDLALFVLHGGPGLDHTMFGDYLDPLADGGRSTNRQRMASATRCTTWILRSRKRENFSKPKKSAARASHVAHGCAFDFFLLLGRKVERVTQKHVGITGIPRVSGDDRVESFSKSNLLHE
jgi:hypothetical protein